MAYINRWETKGVLKIFSGDISGDEVFNATVEIEADPRFDEITYVINDFLQITSVTVVDKDIARLAAIDRAAARTNPNIRIAVVTQTDRIRESAQQYAEMMKGSPYQARVFDSVEQARDWAC